MFGLNQSQFQAFIEKISATAIANQAILACKVSGLPLTVDNAILFIGDHFDPANPAFSGVIEQIYEMLLATIGEVAPDFAHTDRPYDGKIPLPC